MTDSLKDEIVILLKKVKFQNFLKTIKIGPDAIPYKAVLNNLQIKASKTRSKILAYN